MRLEIPLTGTVLVEGGVYGEGRLEGDPADPVRPINIDLGNVSWRMVDVDLEREVMIIEVKGDVAYARSLIHGKTKDELYEQSGSARLKRPFKKGGESPEG